MNSLIDETKDRINQLGIKKSHVAKRIGCSPAELSHFLNGRRGLRPESMEQLRTYLNIR
jgi:transcriptional regulator with XRE-family HTH domain